jgi:hypothetical protein
MFRKQNSTPISHPSLLTACQMALAVTSGSMEQQRGQLSSHQLPRMRTTQQPRKEEAQAHIGLLSHGYYYYYYIIKYQLTTKFRHAVTTSKHQEKHIQLFKNK